MNYSRNRYVLPLLAALIPCAMVVGPVPFWLVLYYCFLTYLAGVALLKPAKVYGWAILFLMACALSIVVGNPPALFKPWPRLGLFALLLMAVYPVISNPKIDRYRETLLKFSTGICSFIGVTGVFCYLAGINYMNLLAHQSRDIDTVGWFGGLAPHSMMLGPCAAIGTVSLAWMASRSGVSKAKRNLCYAGAFCSFLSALLSASRSATVAAMVGFAVLLLIKSKGSISRFVVSGAILTAILVAAFPSYERFAAPVLEKQAGNEEAGGTFSSRENRWNNRVAEFKNSPVFGIGFASLNLEAKDEFNKQSGGIEPGSSWLAILSMTGILGIVTFLGMFLPTVTRLYKRAIKSPPGSFPMLLFPLLSIFAVTMVAEGYVLAGGSFFCFYFWLLFGVCYTTSEKRS